MNTNVAVQATQKFKNHEIIIMQRGGGLMKKSRKMRKLIKSAKMGKPYAMYQLGICSQLGEECAQDMEFAAALISEAAEAGYAPAIEWMKDYCFDDSAAGQAEA